MSFAASDGEIPRWDFGSLARHTFDAWVDIHSREYRPVADIALPATGPQVRFDLFVNETGPSDTVELGFDHFDQVFAYAQLGPGVVAHLVIRHRGTPSAADMPPEPAAIERRIMLQRSDGIGKPREDKLRLTVRFVTSQFVPPSIQSEPPALGHLTLRELAADDASILAVGGFTIDQAPSNLLYRGIPRMLRIATEITVNDEPVEITDTATRLHQRALSPDAAVWGNGTGEAIPLPIIDPSSQLATLAWLEIGIRKQRLYAIVRDAARPGERWNGRLTLRITARLVATNPADANQLTAVDQPLLAVLDQEQRFTVALQRSLQLRIAGAGSIAVPLDGIQPPPTVTLEPYRKQVRMSRDALRNNVDEWLDLDLRGEGWESPPRVAVSVQVIAGAGSTGVIELTGAGRVASMGEGADLPAIRVQLRELMRQAGMFEVDARPRDRRGQLELHFRCESTDAGVQHVVVILPIDLEATAPQWLVCVDLGTSATAVWFGSALDTAASVDPVPLGYWLARTADLHHDEYVSGRPPQEQILIPSHIGLSSELQLRQNFDLLSLGGVSLAGSDPETVGARLQVLGRRYDLSVPFVPASELPKYAGRVIFDPKRRLMTPVQTITLPAPIYELRPDGDNMAEETRQVEIAALIDDYFDELGRYVVPHGVADAAGLGHRHYSANTLLDTWLSGREEVGAVLTYPSGIEEERKQIYHDAGKRLLAALSGAPPGHDAEDGWVKLVPEALAAARFGIAMAALEQRLPDDEYAFGTIDIGAGTYDVTLVVAQISNRMIHHWKVHSHFGVMLGGHDLDRAIASQLRQIMIAASQQDTVKGQFDFHVDLPSTAAELHVDPNLTARGRGGNFLRQVQHAKRVLTDRLMAAGSYRWSNLEDGAAPVRFDVEVWRPDGQDWPIVPSIATRNGGTALWRIDGHDAVLRLQRQPEVVLVLSLGPGVFTAPPSRPDRDNSASIVELMGSALPAMTASEANRLKLRELQWIVTGRASLWPPLYDAIGRTIVGTPGAGRLAQDMPFRPDMMKKAVLLGATDLAREPHLDLGTEVLNPLAILADAQRLPTRGAAGAAVNRVTLRYIDASREPTGDDYIPVRGRFQVVRALPGLDDDENQARRLWLLEVMDIQPWVDICNQSFFRAADRDTANAAHFGLRWRRSDSNIWLTVTDPAASGPYEIGPIPRNGRIYGSW